MAPQGIVRFGSFVAIAGLMLQPAFSQGRGSGASTPTTGSSGGGVGSGSTPGTTTTGPTTTRPPVNTPTQPGNTQTTPQTPIFISGRVLLEDGTPPTESVVIERVCSGSPHSEGYTDSRGYFSIQLGGTNNAVLHDASEDMGSFSGRSAGGMDGFGGGGLGQSTMRSGSMGSDNRFMDCDLRARLVGFRSQTVSLANRRAMDPPDVGTILLHRLTPTEGTTISASSLAAPKDAKKAYEKGMGDLKKKKFDDAFKNFQKAVEVYPNYAAAWFELGRLHGANGDAALARGSFQEAVKAEPKFVSPYMEMAVIDWKAEKWQSVAELTDKVVKLDSFDYPQAYFLNSLANYYLKNMDAAEKSAREAVRLDTRKQYLTTIRLLGVILAQKEDYTGAVEQLKSYLQLAPQASDAATVRNQLSQLEKLTAAKQ
jgi:tetratricopeptide (TPR) repeat protein